MAEEPIVNIVRRYLRRAAALGIHARRGVLFGSFALGTPHEFSDIDLVVIAPEFDKPYTMDQVKQLWRATKDGDDRIEPIPCGEEEWERGTERAIIEIARQEGVMINL